MTYQNDIEFNFEDDDGIEVNLHDCNGLSSDIGDITVVYPTTLPWDSITEKPFVEIGSGLKVVEDVLQTDTFIYMQYSASSEWTVQHNLNKRPSVTVVDSGGNAVMGDVIYIDDNNVKIIFSSAFSGQAYFN